MHIITVPNITLCVKRTFLDIRHLYKVHFISVSFPRGVNMKAKFMCRNTAKEKSEHEGDQVIKNWL